MTMLINFIFFYAFCFRPSFAKLEEWLESLLMHLDIRLHLISDLDKVQKAFWENHTEIQHNNGFQSEQKERRVSNQE